MNVKLIRYTPAPEELCGHAAAKCTAAKNEEKALDRAMDGGHESVLEHACFTFEIDGVSRALLAQITRHRLASFSVQSQRYCRVKPEWVVPPAIEAAGFREIYLRECDRCYALYVEMTRDGVVPAEDARYVIPNGATCGLILTANAREMRHIFELRCCNRAQWEIRDLADQMLALCKKAAPKLFDDAGPGCVRGACPEGTMTCGHPKKGAQNG